MKQQKIIEKYEAGELCSIEFNAAGFTVDAGDIIRLPNSNNSELSEIAAKTVNSGDMYTLDYSIIKSTALDCLIAQQNKKPF